MNLLFKCVALLGLVLSISDFTLSTQAITKTNNIPPILKQCHKDDPNLNECLRRAIESMRANLSQGIPELMIPPCEPLKIPEIRITQNAGAIRMDSEYSNVIIYGLSNFTLRDIHVDPVTKRAICNLWFPLLKMTSNYLIQGKILLMPLMGNGTASSNFTDIDATLTMTMNGSGAAHSNGGKIGDIKVEFNIGGASVHLDNLFGGDPQLGSMMNKFINDNWREITAEIRPALGESIESILYGIANQLNEMYGLEKLLDA
ncbi:protein takeout [Sitodiplosis mosellana]|uniref:protein takeout n=1 Tax=Sitodiplosis mosellana TaxID=263140 RepID=UPI002444787C|nr:protein takeout [Sitodiplosis mosellana]